MGTILSGMRPTGRLHLGHLLGVLNNWKKLQDEYQCYFMVADWHALTSEYEDPSALRENIHQMVIDWLSAGIDPEKAVIFRQSDVYQHAVLHLMLSMIAPLSWLERCPTYKEQMQEIKGKDLSTYGFLGYPLLQAADILLYKADTVPVGEDQLPHLELTREIARRFNYLYGAIFPEPKALLTASSKVAGLDGRKMSKSYDNCIFLSDDAKTIRERIRSAVTDPQKIYKDSPGRPEICNVFTYENIFLSERCGKIEAQCREGTLGCVKCKGYLADAIIEYLRPVHERRNHYEKKPNLVDRLLADGAGKASVTAASNLSLAIKAMGL
ncbi:MAG: tryptophan--tRNA ligase [bacterium]|jgi:tryptophanyl-tRNA synthetase|nr:tryptophan--tRNA ligase [bacterium]MDD3805170.1 tryptophan--tRNA ligase [bacterium]MDD4152475.1 tryptophan--tRNA ligase [bacterium]MDD4557636.1 tryptophan--tRNA ligase [bacterium]